jgi:hypothetical protein
VGGGEEGCVQKLELRHGRGDGGGEGNGASVVRSSW